MRHDAPVGVRAFRRATTGILLIAAVVVAGWPANAHAAPGQEEGECIDVLRRTYRPTERILPPQHPTDYGREHSIVMDGRFITTYCFEDGAWVMSEDRFPYDSSDECVGVYYDPDEHDGDRPPERVSPLSAIDNLGTIDPHDGLTGTENLETYCRFEEEWRRTARADDFPEGPYTEWSRECVTIGPPLFDTPQRTTEHPRFHGNVDFMDFVTNLSASDLRTYCLHNDRDVWYRVDDYPLEEILGDSAWDHRLNPPDEGTCIVVVQVTSPVHDPDNLPEVLPEFGHPADIGHPVRKDEYNTSSHRGEPIDPSMTYCYLLGRWRRADTLDEVCAIFREEQEDDAAAMGAGILPDGCWGAFPTSKYDIGYDGGSTFDFSDKLYGWWTGFFFDIGKGATQMSLWAAGWAYNFDVSKYDQFGLDVGDDYRRYLTHNAPFRLVEIGWLFLFAYAGINMLRGKLGLASGEIIVSIVLLGLSTVLIANRAEYMTSTWELMDSASAALLVAGQGEDPTTASDTGPVVRDVQRNIHGVFIEQTYDYLNWGRRLDGDCAAARNVAVALGPHGADEMPRGLMRDAGCDAEAGFNARASGTRLIGSMLAMVASIIVGFVLLAISLTIIVAKFGALLLFALAPFAALTAIFPAGGRRIAWMWLTTLFQTIVTVIGMSFLLSILLLGLRRLLQETADVGLVERFLIVLLCALAVATARRRMLTSTAAAAGRVADNLSNVRLGGGGAAWEGPRGSTGPNLLGIDRGLRYGGWGAAWTGIAAGAAAGRMVAQRRRESRMWHNAVKARTRGDRLNSVRYRKFYSDVPGGTHGAMPRGGYGDPPGGGSGPLGGGRPDPTPPTQPAGGPGHVSGPHVDPQSPRARAAAASSDGNVHDARYWGGIAKAEDAYRSSMRAASTPQARRRASADYSERVSDLRHRYAKDTNSLAPEHPAPWEKPPSAPHRGPGQGAAQTRQRPNRVIQEVVIDVPLASGWRHPIERARAEIALRYGLRRGRREAKRHDVL